MITQTNTIYVSNSGNDTTGDGTIGSPYKTLAKVQTVLQDSTKILLERGSTFADDGISLDGFNNIVIDAYGTGEKPIMTSFQAVSGWINLSGNIWYHQDDNFPDEITNVMINGVRALIGRYPSATYRTATGGSNSTLVDSGLTNPDGYWDGAELVIRYYDWATGISRVSTYLSKTFTFPIYYQDEETGYYYSVSSGKSYFIQNHVNCLTAQNQWAYNKTTKTLYLYSTTDPNSWTITASYGTEIVNLENSKFIWIQNVQIQGACTVGVKVNNVQRLVIDSVDFTYSGIYAIYIESSKNIKIQNCTSYWSNNDFLNIYRADNVMFTDCTVLYCGTDTGACRYLPIYCRGGTGGVTIGLVNNIYMMRNEVGFTSYSAITGGGTKIFADRNYVHHFNLNKYDGGGISFNTAMFWHTPARDEFIHSNGKILRTICKDGNVTQNSYGLYVDNYSRFFETAYCFSAGCKWNVILHESIKNHVHDNTIYQENGSQAGTSYGMSLPTSVGAVVEDNIYVARTKTSASFYSVAMKTNIPNTIDDNKYFYPLGQPNKINKLGTTLFSLAEWIADDSRVDWNRDNEEEITPSVASYGTICENDFVFYIVNPSEDELTVQSTDVPFDDYLDLDGNLQTYPFTISAWGSKVLVRAPKPEWVVGKINGSSIKKIDIHCNVKLDETSVPATTAFALTGKTISTVEIDENIITLTTIEDNVETDTLTINYTKPGSNMVKAYYGALEMDSFTGKSANLLKFVCTSRGTGAGVSYWRCKFYTAQTLTLDGTAQFYDDLAGTIPAGQSKSISANALTDVFFKVPSGTANLKMTDGIELYQIYNWTGSTANHPSIAGDLGQFIKLLMIGSSVANTWSGDLGKLRDITNITVTGSNTLSGSTKNLISLQAVDIRGSNTVEYDFSRAKSLSYFILSTPQTMTEAQVNQALADIWANRDQDKGTATSRTIDLRGAVTTPAPTGQGLIDKTNLQNYRSPWGNTLKALWTILTR